MFARCSLGVHSVFTRCSLGIRSVFTRCSLGVRSVFTRCVGWRSSRKWRFWLSFGTPYISTPYNSTCCKLPDCRIWIRVLKTSWKKCPRPTGWPRKKPPLESKRPRKKPPLELKRPRKKSPLELKINSTTNKRGEPPFNNNQYKQYYK